MNVKKFVAAAVASVMAVSTMAIAASAALIESVVSGESGKPTTNMWETNFAEDEWDADTLAKVDKVVATVSATAYVNGGMGGNTIAAGGWAASPQNENAGEWVWEGIGGFVKGIGDDGNPTGYFKVELWWQNVNDDGTDSTVTIDCVEFLDSEGNVLYTKGEKAAPAPAETEPDPAETEPDSTPAPAPAPSEGDGKPSTDTGIEGVAVVSGLAILATGAIVIAKKRK